MTTNSAANARKQMKLTATEQAVLLDTSKDLEFANDMGDDDHDHELDADIIKFVPIHVLAKTDETDSPIGQSLNFSFTDRAQINYQPDKWQRFHDIEIVLPSITMGNVIDEFLVDSSDSEAFEILVPNRNQMCNLFGVEQNLPISQPITNPAQPIEETGSKNSNSAANHTKLSTRRN